ncbi:hypothetical protein C0995_003085 [Termitomyces sp. Mi166|nr:hypothetical protein C0995_003085 [Termitomyces sp. Mi166\
MNDLSVDLAPNSYENTVTVLTEAFNNKNVIEVEHIIQTNVNDTRLYEAVRSCIMQCARGGKENAEILVALLKYPHVPINYSIGSEDFIAKAVTSGDLEIFQAMLAVGWDPCTTLKFVGDALTYAVMKDKLALVSWLLDHGAKYDANEACQSFSVLASAAWFASPAVIERLLGADVPIKDSRALEMAVYDGRIDSLACLLDNGGDINEIAAETSTWIEFDDQAAKDGYGAALHTAAKRGHLKAVRYLIDRGADLELRDSKGRTALDLAVMEGHLDIIDLLRSHLQ